MWASRECPDCGTRLIGKAQRCGCGWVSKNSGQVECQTDRKTVKGADGKPHDEIPWPKHCQYRAISLGLECKYPATIKLGAGGLAYCGFHAFSQGGAADDEACRQSQIAQPGKTKSSQEIKDLHQLNDLKKRFGESGIAHGKRCLDAIFGELEKIGNSQPGKTWAHRLIAKDRRGETVPIAALKAAREVLGLATSRRMREPGEDEDESGFA